MRIGTGAKNIFSDCHMREGFHKVNECTATDRTEIMSASLFLMCTLKINVLAYFTLRKGWRALIRRARHYIALKDRRVIWRSELTHMRANGKSERYELRVVTCRRKRTNFTPDAAKLIRIASSSLFLFSARPSAYFLHC